MGQTISSSFVWNRANTSASEGGECGEGGEGGEGDECYLVDEQDARTNVCIAIPIQLDESAVAPKRATSGAAGFDLCSNVQTSLPPNSTWVKVNTGVRLAIDFPMLEGCLGDHMTLYGAVRARSGLTAKGIEVFHGTIDCDYRGEVIVLIKNHTEHEFPIQKGDRVAQLIFSIAVVPELFLHGNINAFESKRASGGFGSTGIGDDKAAAQPVEPVESAEPAESESVEPAIPV